MENELEKSQLSAKQHIHPFFSHRIAYSVNLAPSLM